MLIDRSGRTGANPLSRSRVIICTQEGIWLWPGTALTENRGGRTIPLSRSALLAAACMLHGPATHYSQLVSAVERASILLDRGQIGEAQSLLDRARLPPLTPDGALLMTAIAKRLGIKAPELARGSGARHWSAILIERFSRLYDSQSKIAAWLAPGFIRADWDPAKHPRWPAKTPDSQGGRFAPKDPGVSDYQAEQAPTRATPEGPGLGHNGGPPLFDDAPLVPTEDPGESTRWQVIKRVARWSATKIGILAGEDMAGGGAIGLILDAAQIAEWIHDYLPYIEAYNDPPKTLAELQAAAKGPTRIGYDVHHIVWQRSAKDGIPNEILQSPENLVSIPKLRHWQLNSWFQTRNVDYDNQTPQDYLRDKDFAERWRVGLDGLRKIGVLKP